jgi:tetratricopeptide (TPR) repeat protein
MGGDSYRTQNCLRYYLKMEFSEEALVRETQTPRMVARIGDQRGQVWAVVFRGPMSLRAGEQVGATVVDFPAVSVVQLTSRHETLRESSIAMLKVLVHLMPNRDGTIGLYLALARLHTGSVEGYVYAGNAHLAGGDVEAAAQQFELAIELSPLSAGPHARLGDVYTEQGRFEGAVGHYHQALELRPEWDQEPWIHMRLARAYRGAGRLTEASEEYRRVLELQPDHDAAQAALSELGR